MPSPQFERAPVSIMIAIPETSVIVHMVKVKLRKKNKKKTKKTKNGPTGLIRHLPI